jgi:pyrroloquinoline quinone biosynthesis protein A
MFRFDTPDFVSSCTQTYGMDIAESSLAAHHRAIAHTSPIKETTMTWSKPEFTDWRFGFEITMYIANR